MHLATWLRSLKYISTFIFFFNNVTNKHSNIKFSRTYFNFKILNTQNVINTKWLVLFRTLRNILKTRLCNTKVYYMYISVYLFCFSYS